jgi:hypothetical protein
MRPGTIPPGATGIAKLIEETAPAAATAPQAEAEASQLPPGWVQELDPSSGRAYYVNHSQKKFSWAAPTIKK